MADVNFEMVGRLSLPKGSDKFNPYEEKKSEHSEWISRRLMMNLLSGNNRHSLNIRGGCFAGEGGEVFLFSKATRNADGSIAEKGEAFRIPFKERLTHERLSEVAEFKKFIIDLETPNRRYLLKNAIQRLKDGGNVTEEEISEMDIPDVASLDNEYALSVAKRFEFVTEWDFAEKMHSLIADGTLTNKKVKVLGIRETEYNAAKGTFYTSYKPSRIYVAGDDAEEIATANIKFYFTEDAVADDWLETEGKYIISGYHLQYNRSLKADIPCPQMVALYVSGDAQKKKVNEFWKSQFVVDDGTWKELGITVELVNGAQQMEITYDMLNDNQKMGIDAGVWTLEDLQADQGSKIYGDRVEEDKFVGVSRGYTTGRNDTIYDDEYFDIDAKFLPPTVEEDEEELDLS